MPGQADCDRRRQSSYTASHDHNVERSSHDWVVNVVDHSVPGRCKMVGEAYTSTLTKPFITTSVFR